MVRHIIPCPSGARKTPHHTVRGSRCGELAPLEEAGSTTATREDKHDPEDIPEVDTVVDHVVEVDFHDVDTEDEQQRGDDEDEDDDEEVSHVL